MPSLKVQEFKNKKGMVSDGVGYTFPGPLLMLVKESYYVLTISENLLRVNIITAKTISKNGDGWTVEQDRNSMHTLVGVNIGNNKCLLSLLLYYLKFSHRESGKKSWDIE
ncbi:MAG: hypothetical protein WAM14_17280 [Candidatus Nitrosopolaris sp.]